MDIFGSHECKISLFYKDADDTASKMLPRTWSKKTKERKDVSVGCFGSLCISHSTGPGVSCPTSHFASSCYEAANQEQPQQTAQTCSPPELHPGPSCFPSEGSCFSSLAHSACPRYTAGVCLSQLCLPARTCQCPSDPNPPSLSHHHRPLLLHIPALPSPSCAQPVQLLFTTDTTYH